MEKLKYIKIEHQDGTLSENVPIGVDANNVDNGNETLDTTLSTIQNKQTSQGNILTNQGNILTNLQSQVSSLASGGPAGVYATVAALTSADPNHEKIYIVTENGHWYYYNNGWQDGGIYQAAEDSDLTIANIYRINYLTEYNLLFNEKNTNLQKECLYNTRINQMYRITINHSAIAYFNVTSYCLQYKNNDNQWIDIVRKIGNQDAVKNKYYYFKAISEETIFRITMHSSSQEIDTSIFIEPIKNYIDAFNITSADGDAQRHFVEYPIKKNQSYLLKVRFKNAFCVDNINLTNTRITVLRISGSNSVSSTQDSEDYFLLTDQLYDRLNLKSEYIFNFIPNNNFNGFSISSGINGSIEITDITNEIISEESKIESLRQNSNNNCSSLVSESGYYINWENETLIYGQISAQAGQTINRTKNVKCIGNYFPIKYRKGTKMTIIPAQDTRYKIITTSLNDIHTAIENREFSTVEQTYSFSEDLYIYMIWSPSNDEAITEEWYTNRFDKIKVFISSAVIAKEMVSIYDFNEKILFPTPNSLLTPHLYAHRGYQAEAPENSIPAFKLAAKYGFWGIETDLYATSDNVLVCMHDTTIDRTTDGSGTIANMTYETLSQYHIDTGPNVGEYTLEELRIPTIDDYLSICRFYGLVPFIEIKTDIVEAVIQKLKDYGLEDCAIMSTFDWNLIVKTRQKSTMFIHWINMDTSTTHIDDLTLLKNGGRSFNYTNLNTVPEDFDKTMNNKKVRYCFRAADTVADVKKQIELGVSYIPTNIVKPSQLIDN